MAPNENIYKNCPTWKHYWNGSLFKKNCQRWTFYAPSKDVIYFYTYITCWLIRLLKLNSIESFSSSFVLSMSSISLLPVIIKSVNLNNVKRVLKIYLTLLNFTFDSAYFTWYSNEHIVHLQYSFLNIEIGLVKFQPKNLVGFHK